MDVRGEEPLAALIGTKEIAGLTPVREVAYLSQTARVVVVDIEAVDPKRAIADLRATLPRARCVAWLSPAMASEADALIKAGYDDIAVGQAHLESRLAQFKKEFEAQDSFAALSSLHDGLVHFIGEISQHPALQQVLNIAVLRMSELFSMDRVSVVVFDKVSEVGFVVMEREQGALENVIIRISDYPELSEVIQTKSPLIISDVFGDTLLEGVRRKLTSAQKPHRAAVLFPLMRKNEVVGALFLRSHEPMENIDERMLAMGRLIASVTAVAIGHALEQDMLLSEQRALQRSKAWADEQLAGLQELREFLDHAKDGMLITDPSGVIRYANAAAAAVLRQDQAALPGQRFVDLLPEHCHHLGERALRGDPVGDEYGYVDLTVSTKEAGASGIVISAAIRPLNRPQGVFISFRDVTELREIESELRQTKEFLENLIQSSVDAIIATDTDGRIILFNRAAEQILGYTAREVVGRANVSMLYPRGEAWDVMRKLRSEAYGGRGRLQLVRKELLAKNGETVPVNLTAAMIYEGTREIATVSIFSDLRERRRIEEKLSQVQRKLQMTERQAVAIELAGTAAHELNQPLTSILGYAEMLKRKITEEDPSRKAVEVICRETERMAGIVRKIGQITAYNTKPYVGSSQILDIGQQGLGGDTKDHE